MFDYMVEYRRWLDSPALTEGEWKELNDLDGNTEEIRSRFFAPLEFGTAGLRGFMGLGINRMNRHVVNLTTQAFADVISAEGEAVAKKGIIICYDCRINSLSFAENAASVMAANGIPVKFFEALRPTPELSFAIRFYGAAAGINITASHNPKEYNGYKVYWSDGAQLPPQHAEAIANQMKKINIFTDIRQMDYAEALDNELITVIGYETDEAFLQEVLQQSIDREAVKRVADDFRIVFTPFHGAGYKLVPEALRRLGIKHIYPVEEQIVPDGTFPSVKSPNPENSESFYLAVKLAKLCDSDLIIGTDPDCDRVGVMVRDKGGEYVTISGNQMGVLLLDYIISAKRRSGTLPENAAARKTIVTTEMARRVAEYNGIHMDDTFTGFKCMAEKIAEYEETGSYKYFFAYEESHGYMMGDYVRDKDAVTASMMIAEMAAHYHEQGMTLSDALSVLYEKYGYFAEKTLNIVMPGVDGPEKMKSILAGLRNNMPKTICDVEVLRQRDYLNGKMIVPALGVVGITEISRSNVLYFELEDKSSFIVRPSGTEPKIKVYILVKGSSTDDCQAKIEKYEEYANNLVNL